jgi:hypothetical protein
MPFRRKKKSLPNVDPSWPEIRAEVAAGQIMQRASRYDFKIIPLVELARHRTLPVFQNLESLVSVADRDFDVDDKIFLFISHRWHDALVPDDGTLIDKIFQFCLNAVVKNNFPGLPRTQEVHHSKTLSQKLTALIQRMNPVEVIESQATFGRFDDTIASLSSDPTTNRLISEIMSRFYLWIDFCCLPQVHLANGMRIERTDEEDRIFLAGLDSMDTLLEKIETVISWRASEITRDWLFYESLMSLPRGRASFMMPKELIANLSTLVRRYHAMFSQLGALNSLYMVDTFQEIGIKATSHRDISKIILLMESNLQLSEWEFRIIQ